uniref:PH domain-containing protein n=1 Tax=Salarias fasciatus TaxID=181472 RepID=A0A672GZP7_SALFA
MDKVMEWISGWSGFLFKQWKKRFLLLTAEGSLLVCHDASSPPDQLVQLPSSCEAIVEGNEILDLPRLPSGGCRDCCFALILPQNKYLLLLAETTADCRSHHFYTYKQSDSVQLFNRDPTTPPVSDTESSSPGPRTCASPREKGQLRKVVLF